MIGGPATAPVNCTAPTCATTSTAVTPLPDKKPGLPSTGSDYGTGMLAGLLLIGSVGLAALRRRTR